jgi:hypothetical protein
VKKQEHKGMESFVNYKSTSFPEARFRKKKKNYKSTSFPEAETSDPTVSTERMPPRSAASSISGSKAMSFTALPLCSILYVPDAQQQQPGR